MKLAALVLAAVGAAATAVSPASWSRPTAPFQIADNLYYVGTEGISAFLVTSPKGHILIDGAMPSSAPAIEASIRQLGFRLGDVKILLNTHAHFDHTGGLADLKQDTGAKLFASQGDRKALETGTYPGSEDAEFLKFKPVAVDHVLKDGETVRIGGNVLTAHLTPGHSPGCTTWTFPVKIAGTAHQALLYCSTSVALNRLVSKTKGPQYPGIVDDYRRTFARLKTLKADVLLAPHAEQFDLDAKHAKLAQGAPNAFVDPTELSRTLSTSEAEFEIELARQQKAAQ